ncbi:MAG TPA: BrnA antitoxin family protein [Pyrinomonadaceae bacterium]|nr:BrnA antitoxin family protein [Pyrinomonadaceae bacterium]
MNKQNISKKSQTDWSRIDAMTDDEIDYSDIPPITDEMWAKGTLHKGFKPNSDISQQIMVIDRDIMEFFKSQTRNYQSKINELLRDYMKAHQPK